MPCAFAGRGSNTCNCILIVAVIGRQPISGDSGKVPGLAAFPRRGTMLYRWSPRCICGILRYPSNRALRSGSVSCENLAMDMDYKDILTFLHDGARSMGAEVSSPWFYLQFGLILAG